MKLALITMLLAVASTSSATEVKIERTPLGSGSPGLAGYEKAFSLPEGMFHSPQYLPGYPTAAVLWPRAIEVECDGEEGKVTCNGYEWLQKFGRGEYLFFVPVSPKTVTPKVVTIIEKTIVEKVPVLIEVEPKPKGE